MIKSLQSFVAIDEPEEDEMDLLAIQQDLSTEIGKDSTPNAVFGDDPAAVADTGGDIMAVIGDDNINA